MPNRLVHSSIICQTPQPEASRYLRQQGLRVPIYSVSYTRISCQERLS